MPSRPLKADTAAEVRLHTRTDVEAINVAKGRTDMPAAVARLVQTVPPARLDLIDNVLVSLGRRELSFATDWPPVRLVDELIFRVKRVHLGEVRMRGPDGEVVGAHARAGRRGGGRDPLPRQARVRPARLPVQRYGVFVGEYKTPEELGRVVDLAELTEDDPSEPEAQPS